MMIFDPKNWYWKLAGNDTHVYSSARDQIVLATDTVYQVWLAEGNGPTAIASKAELGDVLAQYNIRPQDADMLDAYRDNHARKLSIPIQLKLFAWIINKLRENDNPQPTPITSREMLKDFLKDEGIV